MNPKQISPAQLEKLLSIQAVSQPPRPEGYTSFLQVLTWMDEKQSGQTALERVCVPGEIIMEENETENIFYIIRSGYAAVVKGSLNTPTVLGFRKVGDAIGEMALLENRPRSATVIALTDVSLWSMSRETFYQFLAENPAFNLNLMSMLSWRIREASEELQRGYAREQQQVEVLEDLSEQAVRDPLTGAFNRRYMDKVLADEMIRTLQTNSTLGILMADVDHFKQVNDTYGHKAGDMMLQELVKLLKHSVRGADSVCRYGGEEFAILMPGASLDVLGRIAEEIRARFEALRLEFDGRQIQTTISLGAASYPQHGSNGSEVLIHADQALYQAKRSGRNRVVIYSPAADEETGHETRPGLLP